MKKFFSLVFVFSSMRLFAQALFPINCQPVGDPWQNPDDGRYYVTIKCSGNIIESIDVPFEGGGDSGGCTNCTRMTPEKCLEIKNFIYDKATGLTYRVNGVLSDYSGIDKSTLEELISLWRNIDMSYPIDLIRSVQGETVPDYIDPGGDNILSPEGWQNLDYAKLNLSDIQDGIVDPSVSTLEDYVSYLYDVESIGFDAQISLSEISEDLKSISDYAMTMDCRACSGGSGGSSNTNSSSSGDCPCSEVLNAIKKILDGWDKKVANFEKGFSMLAFMGTNFVYATQYKTIDGVSFNMRTLDTVLNDPDNHRFDFGEFGSLTWYSRIEYLLLSIAGVYSQTNYPYDTTKGDLKTEEGKITGKLSGIENNVTSISGQFSALHSSINGFYSSFSSGFDVASSSGKLHLFSNWIGQDPLEITIDSTLIQGCRACTSLVWSVAAFCAMYEILLYFWKFFATAIWFWVRGTTAFVK